MNKQTAVEWFFRWVNDNPEATHKEYAEAFEKALQMEKEQRDTNGIAKQLNATKFPFRLYDAKGNEIYFENSFGYWRKYERDADGNVIYYENSNGFWDKYEYDANGNVIYSENSSGDWVKYEYDANGNEIYLEKSDGFWAKWEYDANGNEIYYENSNGHIIDNHK